MKDWAKKMDWSTCKPWERYPLVFLDAFHCRAARPLLWVEVMKRLQSERRRSGTGTRVTLYGPDGPTVSLWAEGNGRGLYERAVDLEQATPEPIDAILQATLWHGKRATA